MHCNERQADISFRAAGRGVALETVMRGEKMQKEVWSQMEIDKGFEEWEGAKKGSKDWDEYIYNGFEEWERCKKRCKGLSWIYL